MNHQVELAEALLRNLRSALRGELAELAEEELAPLTGMSAEELQVLAEAVLAPGHQQQLQKLLEKNRIGTTCSAMIHSFLFFADQRPACVCD